MSDKELHAVWKRLQPLATDKMPVDVPPPRTSRFGSPLVLSGVHWVRPDLVAEITYLNWTDEALLRQVVYQGLRGDKPARDVIRGRPRNEKAPVPSRPTSAPKRIRGRPSGAVPPENILQLLPDAVAPSNEELAAYWTKVSDRALEHLGHRPLKLVRHVHNTTFYHKGPCFQCFTCFRSPSHREQLQRGNEKGSLTFC